MTPQVHGSGHLTHGKLPIPSALQWVEEIGRLNSCQNKKLNIKYPLNWISKMLRTAVSYYTINRYITLLLKEKVVS